ncbi:MAG: addiction module protein [Blastocatellia bacterium]|nr:addiction module protein [Blastocatellia bacterium]
MSVRTSEILEQILALPASDRAELADSILASLEPSDPTLMKLWAAEAEDRVAAFKRGELEAIDAEIVFDEIDRERAK